MRIALVQMNMSESMEENYAKTIRFMRQAAEKTAKLICFPEVQLTPFFAQYEDRDVSAYVTKIDDRYVSGIRRLCKELEIYAAPNFYIEENGRRYDMSLLINDEGKIIGRQKMVHVAQCENFYEQSYYTPSEEGFHVFDTPFGKVGIVVCFDRHYPESIRTEVIRGAELIIIPTANTISEPSELFQWEIRVQAFQNSVSIAMCNRVGIEGSMAFSGESIVSGYNGNILALADDTEQLIVTDLDMSGAAKAREENPYTSLRRPDYYE